MFEDDRQLYAALEDQLRTGGLERIADAVLRLARPAIRLDLTRAEEATIPVGMSKVGGSADLPLGVAWPAWRGVPLPFIAQVQLEEVAALDPEGDLPHRGLLSFFYALNEPGGSLRIEDDPAAWRVLYTENTDWLARHPLPAVLTDGLDTSFPACAVAFSRRLTLPDSHSPAVEKAGLTDDELRGPYLDIVSGSELGYLPEMDHRLLGYPYVLEPDPFLDGYLACNGIERPYVPCDPEEQERKQRAMAELQEIANDLRPALEGFSLKGYKSVTDAGPALAQLFSGVDNARVFRAIEALKPTPAPPGFRARMEELERAADEEWRLLLQVYSNTEAEMDWAGGGVIHFGIARADLAARDFSRVWVDLDFL